jgi:hypothetical protein
VARTRLEYADPLRDIGNPDEAVGLVDQALETARGFGFSTLESRATTFLA